MISSVKRRHRVLQETLSNLMLFIFNFLQFIRMERFHLAERFYHQIDRKSYTKYVPKRAISRRILITYYVLGFVRTAHSMNISVILMTNRHFVSLFLSGAFAAPLIIVGNFRSPKSSQMMEIVVRHFM